MTILDDVIQQLSRLPGLGKKSARRIAYHLLSADESLSRQLGTAIIELKDKIRRCIECGNFTETETCGICQDHGRDRSMLCVVEQPQDIAVIEASHEFRGYYHVLHGVLSPLDGVGPDQLNLASLVYRIRQQPVRELIIATNPTLEGDTTALYLKQLFSADAVAITRLALGLPIGGDLEYVDRLTLARSLRARTTL
jgi:recombination protein RecR